MRRVTVCAKTCKHLQPAKKHFYSAPPKTSKAGSWWQSFGLAGMLPHLRDNTNVVKIPNLILIPFLIQIFITYSWFSFPYLITCFSWYLPLSWSWSWSWSPDPDTMHFSELRLSVPLCLRSFRSGLRSRLLSMTCSGLALILLMWDFHHNHIYRTIPWVKITIRSCSGHTVNCCLL